MAGVQVRSALIAYADIFPPEAPKPTGDGLTRRWRQLLSADVGHRSPAIGLVAEDRGTIVGVMLVGQDPETPNMGHLSRLYVLPECWAQGIGGRLYEAGLAILGDRGFVRVSLWVLERNHRTRSWYERYGWATTGAAREVYRSVNELRYELVLSRDDEAEVGGSPARPRQSSPRD